MAGLAARPRTRTLVALLVVGVTVIAACGSSSDDSSDTSAAAGASLGGTTWTLSPGDALGVDLGDVAVTARFGDGAMSGQSGCNAYTTTYELDGDAITIGPEIARTQRACGAPETAVEDAYLALLPKAATFAVDGTTLTMKDGDGKDLLSYEAAAGAKDLLGDWKVVSYYSGNAITSVLGDVEMTTSFGTDLVSGFSGCNTFTGGYEVTGENIKIGPLASTRMACIEQEVSDQEAQYLAALELAQTFAVTGSRLDLFREGGTFAATLEKA